jgi:hypothetical protein
MKYLILLIVFIFPNWSFSQQISDSTYNPIIQNPEYNTGMGSVVFIDEGHNNFHTKNGRYKAFSNLLERDGYNVVEYKGVFKKNELSKGKILVVSNALNKINVENWFLPTPSAFTKSEIKVVKEWVYNGGSLFLIADHMPMAGAAENLAAEFGFVFTNGFVFDSIKNGQIYFSTKTGTLVESAITKGKDSSECVKQIVSFTGQGFRIPDDAISILKFDKNYNCLLPDTAWVFNEETKKIDVAGWSQGAYEKFGKGRVVVSGEAAMFTAQLAGPQKIKVGMNSEDAIENFQLLLNIIHWLDGKL